MQNLLDWCGVLGFVLSLLLALRELWQNARKLDIHDPEAYAYNTKRHVYCVIRLILSNRSGKPLSVHNLTLLSEHGQEFYMPRRPVWLITDEDGDESGGLRTDDFPVNLHPGESARIVVLFPLRHSDKGSLALPEITPMTPPMNLRDAIPPAAGTPVWPAQYQKVIQIGDWPFHMLAYTSRGLIRLDRTAAVYPALSLLYECDGAID